MVHGRKEMSAVEKESKANDENRIKYGRKVDPGRNKISIFLPHPPRHSFSLGRGGRVNEAFFKKLPNGFEFLWGRIDLVRHSSSY